MSSGNAPVSQALGTSDEALIQWTWARARPLEDEYFFRQFGTDRFLISRIL